MKTLKSLNITLFIFLGLVLGILFGLFMPGRYEFLLPVVYISVNTLCDMGATCCNVLGDLACSVAMKETIKLDKAVK